MSNISAVLTVHNKASILPDVLNGIILKNFGLVKEIIVVLDGCTDGSESIADSIQRHYNNIPPIVKVHTPDVFEIKANNAGVAAASGEYVLLIQDDMVIREPGYDQRLLEPFRRFDRVIAVSGRDAHNLVSDEQGIAVFPEAKGWSTKENTARNIFYIRDSVNRGPLLINREMFNEMGGFDEYFYPQDQDDHDLFIRAYRRHGWITGSYWIDYESKPEWGSTRTGKNRNMLAEAGRVNRRKIIERHGEFLAGPKHDENRVMI